jgi:hypothetical protein
MSTVVIISLTLLFCGFPFLLATFNKILQLALLNETISLAFVCLVVKAVLSL